VTEAMFSYGVFNSMVLAEERTTSLPRTEDAARCALLGAALKRTIHYNAAVYEMLLSHTQYNGSCCGTNSQQLLWHELTAVVVARTHSSCCGTNSQTGNLK
jgi:hypothetical protein